MRLLSYDYTQNGAYFVTCVCDQRQLLFDDLRFKAIVEESWQWLTEHYSYVFLDEFVVMPNHIHAILVLDDPRSAASGSGPSSEARKTVGRLVGTFKTVSARQISIVRNSPGAPVWQRNFYERVIRHNSELNRVRQYIRDNPRAWMDDPENPAKAGVSPG